MVTDVKDVRDGYKMTELGEIPEEWENTFLGNLLKVGYGKNQKNVLVESSEIPILGTGGRIGWSNKPLFSKPSVLIGRKGTIDKPIYIDTPFWTIDTLFYTDIDASKANVKFIYYLFQSIDWYKYNEATGVPSLSASNISKIKVAIPNVKEQQKIAEILSTVDETIETTDQLLEKTKELKKGLMQQLLTKGIGHTEFKKTELGEIPVEWELKTLGQSCQVIMGQSPKGDSYNTDGNGIPLLNGPTEFGDRYPKVIQWTTSPTKFCEDKDILFCVRGSSIGRMNIANQPYCIGRGLAAIRQGNETVTKYVGYVLEYKIEQVLKNTSGSTFPNIAKDELNNVNLPIPSLEEQKKIAEVLSTIDEQIESYEQEKEKHTELKKGLMHQLLTGKTRVKV
jgi:type I restriction enzyme, S subunit